MSPWFFTRRRFVSHFGTIAGALGFSNIVNAASKSTRRLFDGKTLNGWHKPPEKIGHGTGGQWLVEVSGILTGEQDPPGSGNGGILLSDETFGDFDLELELNPDWGPCSGVFFRCTDAGAGFQMYVDYHDNGDIGHLRGEMPGAFAIMPFKIFANLDADGNPGSFETRPDPRVADWPEGVYEQVCTEEEWLGAWKPSEWNKIRLRCVGKYPQITTWLNGLQLCHFNGETSTCPGYDKERVFGLLGREGSIGLQVHRGNGWPAGKKCRWRNIQITKL
jgi:hypothetical protein